MLASIAVALMTEPSGARFPPGKTIVLMRPAQRAASGLMMTSSGEIDPAPSRARAAVRRSLDSHQSSVTSSVSPVAVTTSVCNRPHATQMQHHFGHATRHEHLHRGMPARSVRQRVDESRRGAVDAMPIAHRWCAKPGRPGDRRDEQQQIGRSTECGVNEHRVLDRAVSYNMLKVYL